MKQRNGAGSKRLVEATERFIRSEQKLLEVLGSRRILKKVECDRFTKDLALSVAKKRSSDVFSSAISINKKVMDVLSKSRGNGADRTVSDADVMTELGRVTQTEKDPIEAFRRSLEQIRLAIPFENATLFFMNRESKTLEEALSLGSRVDLVGNVRFGRGRGFSSWVAEQRKPVILNDLNRDGGPDSVPLRSFLSVPITIQNEVVAVVNMSHSRAGAFDEESVERLTVMMLPLTAVAMKTVLLRESERLAVTDTVTTLYNKRHFDRNLESEVGKAKRYGHNVSVVVLDVNAPRERRGRLNGAVNDEILGDMGRILKRSARGTDCVARYGGEEFRILLPHTDAAEAKVAAERLRHVVEQQFQPRRRKLTVHVGVATYPVDANDSTTLNVRAESAVTAAKQTAPVEPAVN
jgi:diguanylate cyclase (GGDEF)-like protein